MANWFEKVFKTLFKISEYSAEVTEGINKLKALVEAARADDGKIDAEEALTIVDGIITTILPLLEGKKKEEVPPVE